MKINFIIHSGVHKRLNRVYFLLLTFNMGKSDNTPNKILCGVYNEKPFVNNKKKKPRVF